MQVRYQAALYSDSLILAQKTPCFEAFSSLLARREKNKKAAVTSGFLR